MGKQGPCFHCGVTSTPLWRNGPADKPVLCNACGSRWRTKGTLANYIPLHARMDPDDYEVHRGVMRTKTMSLKQRDEKLNKRKLCYEDSDATDGNFTPDYNHCYQKIIDEDMSNRSSSGSAISNSESCAQFGGADASDLTGPAQSIEWSALVPSKKRTCVTRPKQSPVEKLTKELYTILKDQASHFSGSSEEDLLFESEAPMVSVEIGHGSVLIRHPSYMAREEESEASSLSVNNMPCKADKGYSNAASLLSINDSKSISNSSLGVGRVKKLNGQLMQLEQAKRDKYNHESFQILCNHNSPLSCIDLTEIINCDVFWGCLTDGEQQNLLKYLPSADTSACSDSLKSMFTSTQFKDNFSAYQKLLAAGVLDTSYLGVKIEDCKSLKKLALANPTKCKWVEQYNMLEHNRAIENTEECISKSSGKSSSSGTLINSKRLRENHDHLGPAAKTWMKCPKRVFLKVDYKRKEPLQGEGSCIIPIPRNLFAMEAGGGSMMLDAMKYEYENSDQDLLRDIPSNGSFPQAELLCPATNVASLQASASSSSIHPS